MHWVDDIFYWFTASSAELQSQPIIDAADDDDHESYPSSSSSADHVSVDSCHPGSDWCLVY